VRRSRQRPAPALTLYYYKQLSRHGFLEVKLPSKSRFAFDCSVESLATGSKWL
jgi:hypothetical protein